MNFNNLQSIRLIYKDKRGPLGGLDWTNPIQSCSYIQTQTQTQTPLSHSVCCIAVTDFTSTQQKQRFVFLAFEFESKPWPRKLTRHETRMRFTLMYSLVPDKLAIRSYFIFSLSVILFVCFVFCKCKCACCGLKLGV